MVDVIGDLELPHPLVLPEELVKFDCFCVNPFRNPTMVKPPTHRGDIWKMVDFGESSRFRKTRLAGFLLKTRAIPEVSGVLECRMDQQRFVDG